MLRNGQSSSDLIGTKGTKFTADQEAERKKRQQVPKIA